MDVKQVQAVKGRNSRKLVSVFILLLALFTANDVRRNTQAVKAPEVVILDALYREKQDFTDQLESYLRANQIVFRSVKAENVTVQTVRNLQKGSKLLVFRVHSTVNYGKVWLLTGETYREDRFILEQLADEVHVARPALNSDRYFSVGSDYTTRFHGDTFKDAVVLVMGCDGLTSADLAAAFTGAGASAYVSYAGPVSLGHTDETSTVFIHTLLGGGTVKEAVGESTREAGADPRYGSVLGWFPACGGAERVPG